MGNPNLHVPIAMGKPLERNGAGCCRGCSDHKIERARLDHAILVYVDQRQIFWSQREVDR